MLAEQKTKAAVIDAISPSTVPLDWEGIVKIHGHGFDRHSFATFNAATPEVIDQNENLVAVAIHPDLTANPGRIQVQVRTIEGALSNEVELLVKPRSGAPGEFD